MPFTIRPRTLDDFPHILAIINSQSKEPMTIEDMHRAERLRPADDPFLGLVATIDDGTIVGHVGVSGGKGMRPGFFSIQVRVDAPYQGQGLGTTLLEHGIRFARERGCIHLEAGVRAMFPKAMVWAERHGFVKEHDLFESTLKLAEWDPTPHLAAVDQVRASGIGFTTLAAQLEGRDRVAVLRHYYDLVFKLARDIPGHDDRPPFPWADWLKWIEADPNWQPGQVLLAVDGEHWVALCELQRRPSGALYNGFTAVDREYRGRGIALAIKVQSIQLAQELGAPYLRTNNHSQNEPMLAVNRRLGYVPESGLFLLKRTL